MLRRIIHPGILLAILYLLAGCDVPGNTAIRFAIASAPASLHPLLAGDAVSERISALLYAPLVDFDSQQRPLPGQVYWERLSDTHYRFGLSAGLHPFSNGRMPRLEDVQATLREAIDNPLSPHAGALAHVETIALNGKNRLDVQLSRPDPRFVEKLHLGLVPAEAVAYPAKLARQPVGNGPFRLVAWDEQNNLLLQRRGDRQAVSFHVVPDPTMRALKLMHGEIDLLQNDLPYEMYGLLQSEPGIQLKTNDGSTFAYLGFNLDDPVTGDLRVRQAIAHAVNRVAIIRYLFKGHASLANTLLRPDHWAAHPGLPGHRHDPQKARALLAEAGYGPGNPLHLGYKTSTDPFRLRVAAALQAQLAEVGIHLDIRSHEWGTFFSDIKRGRFQLYSLSWVGIRSPDIFRHVYHSRSTPPDGANRGGYRSQDADGLIELADRSPIGEAVPLYRQLQARVHEDLVYVPLWHEHNLLLARAVATPPPRIDGGYQFLEEVSPGHE